MFEISQPEEGGLESSSDALKGKATVRVAGLEIVDAPVARIRI